MGTGRCHPHRPILSPWLGTPNSSGCGEQGVRYRIWGVGAAKLDQGGCEGLCCTRPLTAAQSPGMPALSTPVSGPWQMGLPSPGTGTSTPSWGAPALQVQQHWSPGRATSRGCPAQPTHGMSGSCEAGTLGGCHTTASCEGIYLPRYSLGFTCFNDLCTGEIFKAWAQGYATDGYRTSHLAELLR